MTIKRLVKSLSRTTASVLPASFTLLTVVLASSRQGVIGTVVADLWFDWSLAIEPETGSVDVTCSCVPLSDGKATISFYLPLTCANVTITNTVLNISRVLLQNTEGGLTYEMSFNRYDLVAYLSRGTSINLSYCWPDGALPSDFGYLLSYGEKILPLNGPGTINITAPRDPLLTGSRLGEFEVSYRNRTMCLVTMINKTEFLDPLLLYSDHTPTPCYTTELTEYGCFYLQPALSNSPLARRNVRFLEEMLDRVVPMISNMTAFSPPSKINVSFVPYPFLNFRDGEAWLGGGPVQIRYTILFREFNESSEETIIFVHELVHALTPDRKENPVGYPAIWTEGIAELFSAKVLGELGYEDRMIDRRRELFLTISRGTIQEVWSWDWNQLDRTTVSNNYLVAYFALDYYAGNYGMASIAAFLSKVMSGNLTLKEGDRGLFIDELSSLTGSNASFLGSLDEQVDKMLECINLEWSAEALLASLRFDWCAKDLNYSYLSHNIDEAVSLFNRAQYDQASTLLRNVNERLESVQVGIKLLHGVESYGILCLFIFVALTFLLLRRARLRRARLRES